MNDVVERIRAGIDAEQGKRERNRREFPGVSAIVDEFTAAFGPVKVLHAIEDGREIGKAPSFNGLDVEQIIRLDDWRSNRR